MDQDGRALGEPDPMSQRRIRTGAELGEVAAAAERRATASEEDRRDRVVSSISRMAVMTPVSSSAPAGSTRQRRLQGPRTSEEPARQRLRW
jgi:hypothetical protein